MMNSSLTGVANIIYRFDSGAITKTTKLSRELEDAY